MQWLTNDPIEALALQVIYQCSLNFIVIYAILPDIVPIFIRWAPLYYSYQGVNQSTQLSKRSKLMSDQNFAIEPLETRLEQFCITVPYIGTCSKRVWFVTVYYPCVKYYRYCF